MAANAQAKTSKLQPWQRNQLFAAMTRQHIQKLPSFSVTPGSSVSFDIPKARLLSDIMLEFKGTLTATHASETTFDPATFAPYNLIKKARVEMSNSFAPFNISGIGLSIYNQMELFASRLTASTTANARGRCLIETVASSSGAENDVRFFVRLPLTLNKRDPIGLINVQNPSTTVTVSLEFNALTELLETTTGFTLESSITCTPHVETFTTPPDPNAIPDMSTLKIVHEIDQSIAGSGDVTVKLPIGQTYRRIAFYITDDSGGEADASIGDFYLMLNQADIPYRISPFTLQALNEENYMTVFPAGVFVIDFASQGFANYGGSRDYVDTEKLTEYWLRFAAAAAGNVKVVMETLARLK